jgi:streptomycin 6-kinase
MAHELQPLVLEKLAEFGAAGAAWVNALPVLLGELEQEWRITVGETLEGGTAGYVARAVTADGKSAVLKIGIPDSSGFARQMETIEAAKGCGYVALLAKDTLRQAMLMEALGPSLDHVGFEPERALRTLCDTLLRAWELPREGLAGAEEKAHSLGLGVARRWDDLGRPCSERVVTQALLFAERRAAAFDLERCAVVHGDPHPGNALKVVEPRAGAESGFVFVDPDGFLADRAYDLGVALRDWSTQILAGGGEAIARRYCALLAEQTGVDETAIWEWGFLERVSTGLYLLQFGAEDLARRFLDTAEILAT